MRAKGIQGDTIFARCGTPEESINHVFLNVHWRFSLGNFYESYRIHTSFHSVTIRKHRSFILDIFPATGRSSICMDLIVFMEKKEQ